MVLKKLCATSALVILVGGATLLLFGCPDSTEDNSGPYVCANGTAEQGTSATQNETRCVSCNPGFRLDGNACAINAHTCLNGVAAAGRPKTDGETRCEQCNPTFRLVDKQCVPTAYRCDFGVAAKGQPTTHKESLCVSCDAGFHLENNICERSTYACPNGDPFLPPATTHGTVKCLQCDAGYHLNEDEECEANAYVCANGTARSVSDGLPATHNQPFCVMCDTAGHGVRTDAVTGSQVCGGNNYICFNGVATSGTATAGTESCVMCDAGYRLESARCVAHQYACPNGSAARGIPAVDEEVRCVSCAEHYRLEGTQCVPKVYEHVLGLAAIGQTLYMTGDSFDRLYTVDTATGALTAVSPNLEGGFGVGETSARELAAIGDTLYMVGNDHDRLYTLDTATGAATAVDPTLKPGFGVGETAPRGLAAIGGTLYMVGDALERALSVNPVTGVATVICARCRLFSPRGLAVIGGIMYLNGGIRNDLHVLDVATGTYDLTPNSWHAYYDGRGQRWRAGNVGFGVGEYAPTGLASIGDTLYLGGYNSRLYTVNRDTGWATLVGTTDVVPRPSP